MVNSKWEPNDAALDRVFAALSDSTRRAMLQRLKTGETTVGRLAEPFDMSLPAITKHLNVLEDAGLISRHRDGRTRICRLEPETAETAMEWMRQQALFWESSLDRLDRLLSDEEAPNDA